ncbi:uncharacterized protein N7506_010630 [Penicillium brevicompactum]|uniref:uncharacterized protein n=1 Tax=Penicillium brevicompactum TaxID=5074 RepID=UPI00253F9463|nr:uncharacterized protein N7506_010630 [Penicillium brevicompactum]KAJ5327528.1 hypothetical protein N7506_010630 [Penicillium brevicompactum]
MAPIRRYLRISKYSVLECRIYLDAPSDSRWLLNPRDPVLPRVIAAIQPLVLPKLREENQRLFSRKKSKPVKDVIAEDDFEVAIFLRESRTRHSILTRNKTFHGHGTQDKNPDSVSGPGDDTENPTGSTNDEIMIESDSEPEGLHDIPESTGDEAPASARPKRKSKLKAGGVQLEEDTGTDEKKLRFSTHYESFNICGWVLCLLVTRKGGKAKSSAATAETPRQPLMEEWISTQAQASVDD